MADDLTGWLRSVRPHTSADDNWAESDEAADVLSAVHRRTARRRPVLLRGARTWLPAATTFAAAAAVVIVAASSGGSGPAGTPLPPGHSNPVALPKIRPAAKLLSSFTSCDNLLAQLRKHAADSVTANGLPGELPYYYYGGYYKTTFGPELDEGVGLAASASSGQPDTSGTNVQEAGVDEPDLVKTDGDRVITLTDGVLRVLDDGSHTVTGTLDLTMYDGWQTGQLLVDGDNALVIMSSAEYGFGAWRPALPANLGSTLVFVSLDSSPHVTGSMRLTGSYLDARQIGTTVRLVVSSAPRITFPTVRGDKFHRRSAYQQIIRQAPLSVWLPTYSINAGTQAGAASHSVPCTSVSSPAEYTAASMITVYTLDLTDLGGDPHPISVTADGDTVYATETSLYVASNPDWYDGSAGGPTELHRFDITGSGPPTYLGSGSVPGRLLNRYSLSEYDGTLRVATTTGAESATSNGMYALDAATLHITGQLTGIADGEQIYAVRFLGPMGYVVTYHQTDPLFVLDLHDPAAPKIAGRLDQPGYSVYLQNAGNDRLLGVGQARSDDEQQTMQVALYDIANAAHPTRTGQVVVPNSYVDDGSFDPHSFLYWQPTGLVAVPTSSGKDLVVRVAGAKLTELGTIANPVDPGTTNDGLGIQRTMIVAGQLWTLSSTGMRVSDPNSLDQTAWIPFPTP